MLQSRTLFKHTCTHAHTDTLEKRLDTVALGCFQFSGGRWATYKEAVEQDVVGCRVKKCTTFTASCLWCICGGKPNNLGVVKFKVMALMR